MKTLNQNIQQRLDNLRDIPTIPTYLSRVLKALDNTDISAKALAELIEKDQALTAKVLKVANSPIYGQRRKVSTVEIAIILMGLNPIKEMIISMFLDKFFQNVPKYLFDVESFWNYSIFCAASSRVIAKRYRFKLTGEAFIAGLMHDMGLLIIVQSFSYEYREIKELIEKKDLQLIHAEKEVLGSTHADIGAWLGKKWHLPDQLCEAIQYHHTPSDNVKENEISKHGDLLTEIVSLAEWFSVHMGFYNWCPGKIPSYFYGKPGEFYEKTKDKFTDKNSWLAMLKRNIHEEYQKANEINKHVESSLF